jgi:hypothetical protein
LSAVVTALRGSVALLERIGTERDAQLREQMFGDRPHRGPECTERREIVP